MPNADYFRKQAKVCRRMSAAILDEEAKASLLAMAEEYDAQAERLEVELKPPIPEE